jgi:hypothetical protein
LASWLILHLAQDEGMHGWAVVEGVPLCDLAQKKSAAKRTSL